MCKTQAGYTQKHMNRWCETKTNLMTVAQQFYTTGQLWLLIHLPNGTRQSPNRHEIHKACMLPQRLSLQLSWSTSALTNFRVRRHLFHACVGRLARPATLFVLNHRRPKSEWCCPTGGGEGATRNEMFSHGWSKQNKVIVNNKRNNNESENMPITTHTARYYTLNC